MAPKRKRSIFFFAALFVGIFLIMIIGQIRDSRGRLIKSVAQGFKELHTINDSLVAIATDNTVYLWPWDKIENDKPYIMPVPASLVTALADNKILWIPSDYENRAFLSSIDGVVSRKYIDIDSDWQCLDLCSSADGKAAALVLSDSNRRDAVSMIKIHTFIAEAQAFVDITSVSLDGPPVQFTESLLSRDSAYFVILGSQDKKGFLQVIDLQGKRPLWQKQIPSSAAIATAVFSLNGSKLYCAGDGINIYCYDTISGDRLQVWQRTDYQAPHNITKRITSLVLSPSGNLIAATSDPSSTVWIWRTETLSDPTVIKTGNIHLNTAAFSPDSKRIISASFKVVDKMQIWDINEY